MKLTETRVLQIVHLIVSFALVFTLLLTDARWWVWVVVLLWGSITQAWGFSLGWDTAFKQLMELGEKR